MSIVGASEHRRSIGESPRISAEQLKSSSSSHLQCKLQILFFFFLLYICIAFFDYLSLRFFAFYPPFAIAFLLPFISLYT